MNVEKSFECVECDYVNVTTDYWYETDFTDNGAVEVAFATCPNCKENVIED